MSWSTSPACRRSLKKRKTGTFPYIVSRLRNYESVIPYFTVTFPDGGRRKAWLLPPEYDDEVAKIRLESCAMSLGCEQEPQHVTLVTNAAGVNVPLLQFTPVLMQAYNKCVGKTWRLGCRQQDASRKLIYTTIPDTADTCLAGPPTDTWFVLSTTNLFQQYLYSGVTLLCRTLNGNVLRALPTLSADVYELAWREPASPEGFDVDLTTVLVGACLSCDRIQADLEFPANASASFGLGGCCG